MDIEKREKEIEAIHNRAIQFVEKYPDKQAYFEQIFTPENINQKTIEDTILFNQVSLKVLEDLLKLYNDDTIKQMNDHKDTIRLCEIAIDDNHYMHN